MDVLQVSEVQCPFLAYKLLIEINTELEKQ